MAFDVTITTPLSDSLHVVAFSGTEALSDTFLWEVELSCANASVDFTQIVGQPVALTVTLPSGDSQFFHGVVTAFRQGGQDSTGSVTYFARVEPWFALLRMNVQQQIFQNKTALDIIKAVFGALSLSDFKDSTTGTYTPREYCVQYGETTFDFLSRLMESEGIFYFFTHTATAHTLVLADDASAYTPVPGSATLQFAPTERPWEQIDAVTSGHLEQRLVPVQVSADDFNFVTPTTDLYSTTSGTGGGKYSTALSIYQYPGIFQAQADGETATGLTLTSLEAEQQMFSGITASRAFHAGGKFTLAGHYRADANTEYVLRSVQHSYAAANNRYSCTFRAFPSANTFRPPQGTPPAIIRGVQTAIVVGKSGEEIWTDQYGRIKVKFHWDQSSAQDDTASCWIRVAQGWAGQQWGAFFLPRVGQEVIVQFLEGNPDRPIVTGCVYNGAQTVPYALPGEQTKTTIKSSSSKGNSGNNELRFEDKAGSEEVFLQAQKDLNITVLGDQTSTITNNRSTTVSQKDDTLTISQGNRTVAVSQGNETHTVGGKRDLTVTGNETHTNQAKFTQTVTGDFALSISGNLTISVDGSVSIQAGTTLTQKASTGMSLQSDGTMESKANATNSVQGQAMVEVKGGLVKIN
jgi:type VI secretion system secreted protein VgrG